MLWQQRFNRSSDTLSRTPHSGDEGLSDISLSSSSSSSGSSRRSQVMEMDNLAIADFLKKISMEQHANKFMDLELGGSTLSQLTASDLHEIPGICKLHAAK